MLLSEAEAYNDHGAMVNHIMPFGVGDPMHARKLVTRNLGGPESFPSEFFFLVGQFVQVVRMRTD